MSLALYPVGGLRFWTGREIMIRRHAVERIVAATQTELRQINGAWRFEEIEGPVLTPRSMVSTAYDGDDIWDLQSGLAQDGACLRPETTASSYAYLNHLIRSGMGRLPLCVWQAGKSFRRETNDGASPSRLRFLEFWQLELQCAYSETTKADYRAAVLPVLEGEIASLTGRPSHVVESDRLPAYSLSTLDIEVERSCGRWCEMASVSIRTDLRASVRVLEIAVGLDRVASVANEESL